MNRLLMVAFHYPPCVQSSGIHRTLKFSRYLPEAGWQPIILTAHPRAYSSIGDEQLGDIPPVVAVARAFALDTSRHLAVRGAYLPWLALPDRFASWWLGAVPIGLRLIRRYRPQVLWSTYPVATAHLIGLTLHRITGLPWVADFRDSMTEDYYPSDETKRKVYLWIERKTATCASRLVFTADSTRRMYLQRYSDLSTHRCVLIPNGYDENDFRDLTPTESLRSATGRPLRLIHAGVIYPEERDPTALFQALARLKRNGLIRAEDLNMELRASGFEEQYARVLRDLEIDDVVRLLPPLPYRQMLQECLETDALVLLQGASCNHQIPAKAYEYLRAQKPILALTAAGGDTASLLKHTGGATIVDLADEKAIYSAVPSFVGAIRRGDHPVPDLKKVEGYARDAQALTLARELRELLPTGRSDAA